MSYNGEIRYNPRVLAACGEEVEKISNDYNQNITRIYEIILEMVEKDYISASSKEIARRILEFKGELDDITIKMRKFAGWCTETSEVSSGTHQGLVDMYSNRG